jgi:hypothetical protein
MLYPNRVKLHNKMDKELKQKWIDALRSGEYQQGKKRLCTEDGRYCCLGVLQMVADGVTEPYTQESGGVLPSQEWTNAHPVEFYNNVGNPSRFPAFRIELDERYNVDVWELNDVYEFTFSQIADLIEKQVEGV